MKVNTTLCPKCGALGSLGISSKMVANPIGSFSLSGRQMKFTARAQPILACAKCDLELMGEYRSDKEGKEYATFDPRDIIGGENATGDPNTEEDNAGNVD